MLLYDDIVDRKLYVMYLADRDIDGSLLYSHIIRSSEKKTRVVVYPESIRYSEEGIKKFRENNITLWILARYINGTFYDVLTGYPIYKDDIGIVVPFLTYTEYSPASLPIIHKQVELLKRCTSIELKRYVYELDKIIEKKRKRFDEYISDMSVIESYGELCKDLILKGDNNGK